MLLLVAMTMLAALTAAPVLAKANPHANPNAPGQQKKVIEADSPLPVEGETASGGTVEGTLEDATLTVDPETETVTVEGDLVGEVTQPSGTEVPISEPISETTDLTQEVSGTTCDIGYITLDGTLTVALLGLHLNITELEVTLTGDSSEGLLGNLLCGLAGTTSTEPTV